MGCNTSLETNKNDTNKTIRDSYETQEQFTKALRNAGLEKCNLLLAIDFTKSNEWQGTNTFNGKCLHSLPILEKKDNSPPYTSGEYVSEFRRTESFAKSLSFNAENIYTSKQLLKEMNPYQYVLSVAGSQLESFDEDKIIPTCIFGYQKNKNEPYLKNIGIKDPHSQAKLSGIKDPHGINEVLEAYENSVRNNGLSGGTLFAPIISWATAIVSSTKEYHILIIIGDGCIDDFEETKNALKYACNYPLSIVFVGVGDESNPEKKDKWETMRRLDDEPSGDVDNWQSVYLANIKESLDNSPHPDVDLAVQMFMEIPEQYKYFKSKNMIK